MRTLTSKVTSAVESLGTVPRYLIELGYSTPLRWSTVETLTWNSLTWDGSTGASVSYLSTGEGGSKTAAISVPNHDNAIGAVVLGDGIRGITAKIWQLYGDAPHAVDDAVQLFDGYIDSVPSLDDYATISLLSTGAVVAHTPRIRLATFVGDDMPVAGTRISWNGDVLILKASS